MTDTPFIPIADDYAAIARAMRPPESDNPFRAAAYCNACANTKYQWRDWPKPYGGFVPCPVCSGGDVRPGDCGDD